MVPDHIFPTSDPPMSIATTKIWGVQGVQICVGGFGTAFRV
jgi:hypothetical protein